MAVRPETPRQGEWIYDQLIALPDDGKRYEIVEGVLREVPSPSLGHQDVVGELYTRFRHSASQSGDKVVMAPFDVLLTPDGRVTLQPDIFVVAKERIGELGLEDPEAGKAVGAPDLVVEVLSPRTSTYDRGAKLRLYEAAGAKEYWLVSREVGAIEILTLVDGRYRRKSLATGNEVATSGVFAEMSFTVSEIFE